MAEPTDAEIEDEGYPAAYPTLESLYSIVNEALDKDR